MGDETILFNRRNSDIEALPAIGKIGVFFSAYHSEQVADDLRKVVRRETPDAAIVQNVFPLLSPSVYATLEDLRIPTVQAVYNYRLVCPSAELYTEGAVCERCVPGNTVHAVIHRCYRESYLQSAWYASIIGWHRWRRTFADKISSFMVPDNFLGAKLVDGGIPAGKVWRNPNPFFVEDYAATSQHDGYVLFVGRLDRQKGVLTLLDAMQRTESGGRLVIVGEGRLEAHVRLQAASPRLDGQITWLGSRWGNDLSDLIRGCVALVIPSEWYDNLPMILCKANAHGKPVIAARIDGLSEYVLEGANGHLFDPGDAAELAALIDRVLRLSAAEYSLLSKRSRAVAEEAFAYGDHYRRLVERISGRTSDAAGWIST